MEKIKILIIEDEESINNIVKSYLVKEGYEVYQAFDGEEGLRKFLAEDIDLVILDLMLPKMLGEDVMKEIRNRSEVPVIMLSAKVEENDKVTGLRLGADDYITKPFSARELEMDLEYNRFFKDGVEIYLTKNEFSILKTLFSNPNKIYTRDEIIEITFGYDYDAYDRAIDTHIKNIRQKIEDSPKKPMYIKTIYGMGYKSGGIDDYPQE